MLLESLVRVVPEVTTVEVSIASGSEGCSGTSCSETASLMSSSSSSLANEDEDIPFFRLAVFSSDGDWARPNICRNDAMYSLARNIIFSWGIRWIDGTTILQARGPSVFFRLRDKLHVTLPLGLLCVSSWLPPTLLVATWNSSGHLKKEETDTEQLNSQH